MKMCQNHWDMLRAEIDAQGMGHWVSQGGEIAALQLLDQIRRQQETPVNYDPLMACHMMIMSRAGEMVGVQVFMPEFGCPICRFNESRNPDGSCRCDDPHCEGKVPGAIPDFETWIVGPESCVMSAREYMTKKGWLK